MFLCCWHSTLETLKTFALTVFVIYIAIPVVVKTNPWILNKLIFLHFVKFPFFDDFSDPKKKGIKGTTNFYITVNEKVKLGTWHVLPEDLQDKEGDHEEMLKSGHPVVLYLHGNAHTRAQAHRVELYKILSSMNLHVIAIDYRGFGDSTGIPSEPGVLEDTYEAYKWIKERCQDAPLYIWGHSLGTAISTNLVKFLNGKGEYIDGLILESPFNNLRDAALHHPLSLPFRFLPWFEWTFIESFKDAGIDFNTDENIKNIDEPVLILHAEDDHIIPFECGRKLHESTLQSKNGDTDKVHFKTFERKLGYRHNDIYRAPELPNIIRNFLKICSENK